MNERADWTLTVSDLNAYVDRSLKSDPILRSVRLSGEISGFKANASGHWYFTLKDEQSRIDCVLFRQNAQRVSFRPAEGDQVLLHGYVTVYGAAGRYQFVADAIRPMGIGGLYQQFERLKNRLEAEGLFDQRRKRPLPVRPRKIVVVTSETGAVWHDICHIASERDPSVPIVLIPSSVQGSFAAPEIVEAIRLAGMVPEADVLIVGRGGGSMEDLWCFNEEIVARAIAACPIPVISAVGHETDFTIADFAADMRASTPSHASELAVPDRSEMVRAFHLMRRRFDSVMDQRVNELSLNLLSKRRRIEKVQPDHQLALADERIALARVELDRLMDLRLQSVDPKISMLSQRLEAAADRMIEKMETRVSRDQIHLNAVSPMRVLERGYAYVTNQQGAVQSAAAATDHMEIHFCDGSVNVCRE